MRVGVVSTAWGDPRSEEQLFARRLAAVAATRAEVEILLAGRRGRIDASEGPLPVREFDAKPRDSVRRAALMGLAVGTDGAGRAEHVPELVQRELALAAGGYSSDLFSHLAQTRYDTVLFIGYANAASYFGVLHVQEPCRVVLVPAARAGPELWFGLYDHLFRRADAILAATEGEARLLRRRVGRLAADRVRNVRFLLRVDPQVRATRPVGAFVEPYVAALTRGSAGPVERLARQAELLLRDRPQLRIALLGGGVPSVRDPRLLAAASPPRMDVWRWMGGALAVIDPEPDRLLANEVLEAMLLAVPVIVRDGLGAGREHAEASGGGLWYRDYWELVACIDALQDESLRAGLGAQGRQYAEREYSDRDRFTEHVRAAVLGAAPSTTPGAM